LPKRNRERARRVAKVGAETAGMVLAPELTAPLLAALSRPQGGETPPMAAPTQPQVIQLPRYAVTFKKPRVSVRTSKGVSYILLDPGRGLSAKETGWVVVLGGAAFVGYEVEKWAKKEEKKLAAESNPSSLVSWLNPLTWHW
jgi:hypothetical protein